MQRHQSTRGYGHSGNAQGQPRSSTVTRLVVAHGTNHIAVGSRAWRTVSQDVKTNTDKGDSMRQ